MKHVPDWGDYDASAPFPGGPIRWGSRAHLTLARICLAEHDRGLSAYDPRLKRPRFVPAMIRLALKFAGKPQPARAS